MFFFVSCISGLELNVNAPSVGIPIQRGLISSFFFNSRETTVIKHGDTKHGIEEINSMNINNNLPKKIRLGSTFKRVYHHLLDHYLTNIWNITVIRNTQIKFKTRSFTLLLKGFKENQKISILFKFSLQNR